MVLLEKYVTADIATLPSEGGRFVYDSTTNLLKFRDTVGTSTVVSSDSTGNVNIITHNGSTTGLQLNSVLVTATAAELNLLDGVTATTAELNYVDLTTGPGTAQASKALVLNSSSNITTGINSLASSELNVSGHDGSTIGLSLAGTLVTATATELNTLDGITSSTAELNLLDGVTATTAELNYVDLTTGPGTAQASKALVLNSSSNITTGINSLTSTNVVISGHDGSSAGLTLGGTLVTSTAVELNLLDGVTATTAELNYVDLTTGPGTAEASKALVLNSSSNITTGINSLASSELNVSGHNGTTAGLSLAGTLVTATAAELNTLDGITSSTAELNLLDGVTATTAELNYVDLTTGPGTAEASKALVLNSSSNITTGINSLASSELNVSGHNGTTAGLSLAGTLVTATAAELNTLDGITSSTAELNLLDGVTATTAELNYVDLTTGPGTAEASKALVLNSSSNITTGINSLTSALFVSTSSTASTSNSTGSVLLSGGLAISNSTDASSSTNGGTFTTAGGAAIAKSLYVGLDLSVAGNLTVAGTTTTIESITTVIEDNTLLLNSGPSGSGRDAGFLTQRFQIANQAGTGDVVSDSAKATFALDDATSTTITLPSGASSVNDFYNNWWIKVTSGAGNNNVRQITDYDGTTKVATLASAFTTTPSTADTVNLYNKPYSTFLWQEATNSFISAFVAADITGALNIIDYADFRVNGMVAANTTSTVLNVSGHNGIDAGLSLGGTLVTITAAQLNALAALSIEELSVLDGLTATTAELNYNDLTTGPGTAEPSKTLVLNSSSNISGINTLNATTLGGTLSTASQPNITSLGTLTSLSLSGALSGVTTLDASGIVTFTDTTASTSPTVGALKLSGGLSISNTTEATSSTNGGTFTSAGGMAVAKKLFVGGDFSAAGSAYITGNVGINTSAPSNQLEINSTTGECLRLTYNDNNGSATNYVDMEVDNTGILYIKPSSTTAFLEVSDSSVNTTLNIFRLSRLTSGTATTNIGVGLSFDLENATGTSIESGSVQCVLTSAVDNAENSNLVFNIINNGTVTSRAVLTNAGNFSAVTLTETSDKRVKENITSIDSADSYEKINRLEIVDYNFTSDSDKRVHRGVIAQDLLKVIPNAVYIQDAMEDSEIPDLHTVSSKELLGNLLSAFQHLSKKVEKLEEDNALLKAQLS
jgi:hypothetical protein